MASSTRPKRPKAPPPRLNLEEMEQDPSMKGMLSFLEVSPAEKLQLLQKRARVDAAFAAPPPVSAEGPENPIGYPTRATVADEPEVMVAVETMATVSPVAEPLGVSPSDTV